jgi:hypothetical protein
MGLSSITSPTPRTAGSASRAGGESVARADDGDERHRQRLGVAALRDRRRRIVDHLRSVGIAGFADRDVADAGLARGSDFALGLVARTDLTFWLRMSCSQSSRCSSVRRLAFVPSSTPPPSPR